MNTVQQINRRTEIHFSKTLRLVRALLQANDPGDGQSNKTDAQGTHSNPEQSAGSARVRQ